MKPYIQGMNLALFEFAALFLFARQDQPRTRHRNRLLRHLRSCKLFRPGISRRAHPAVGHSFDLDPASVADKLEYKLNRTAVIVLICFVLLLVLEFSRKRLSEKKIKARIARVCLALSCGLLLCFGYTKMLHSEDIVEQKLHLYNKLFTPTTIHFKNGTVTAFFNGASVHFCR